MKLSTQEEYGLRCLLRLGQQPPDASLTISELSRSEGISSPNVAKMLRVLRKGGLVRSTRGKDGGERVEVRFTLTAPGCGMGDVLKEDIARKVLTVPGVKEADVQVQLDPPWDQTKMSDAARLQLGLM